MAEATTHNTHAARHVGMPRPAPLAFSLGVLQFLFLLSWTVYVVFLGDLLERAGLPKDVLPKLLLADQIVFACMDVLLGWYADRARRGLRRLTPLLLALNLASCLLFISLPFMADVGPQALMAVSFAWVASATVLRAPLYGAIARYNAQPGRGTAIALLGMGLASAASPYLGGVLKGWDPVWPFLISGLTLALATLGFRAWERAQPDQGLLAAADLPSWRPIVRPLIGLFLIGLGFQIHFFLNAARLFKDFVGPDMLPWLMPVFWAGFSLAVYPGARLVAIQGPARVFIGTAFLGALASYGCGQASSLTLLIGLQALAGACWGLGFLSALELATLFGRPGRESSFIGTLFAVLALATALRIGVGTSLQIDLQLLSPILWGLGALAVLPLARSYDSRIPS